MKKLLIVCSAVTLIIGNLAFAGSYKSAGCGFGSMVIKDDGFVQIFAATTNGTSGSQTFGISSGTLNCGGSGGYVKAEHEQEMYVSSNLDTLSQEIAQGKGEHLNALASLMGCDTASAPLLSATLKKNYRSVASSDADAVLNNVKATIKATPALSASCSNT